MTDVMYLASQAKALRKTPRQAFGPKSLRTAVDDFACQVAVPEICTTEAPYIAYEDEFVIPIKVCGPCRMRLAALKACSHWEFEDRMRTGALRTLTVLMDSGRLKLVQKTRGAYTRPCPRS